MIVARVRLQQIHNVELIVDTFADIGHLKVVPLLVRRRVIVMA